MKVKVKVSNLLIGLLLSSEKSSNDSGAAEESEKRQKEREGLEKVKIQLSKRVTIHKWLVNRIHKKGVKRKKDV